MTEQEKQTIRDKWNGDEGYISQQDALRLLNALDERDREVEFITKQAQNADQCHHITIDLLEEEKQRLRKALGDIVNTVGQWSWEDAIKVARQALAGEEKG